MATDKTKGGNGVTWWKHLLHKLDPSASNSCNAVPAAANGSNLVGSVTSSVEAFADGSGASVSVCKHHKGEGKYHRGEGKYHKEERKEKEEGEEVNGKRGSSRMCVCPSCPCVSGSGESEESVVGKSDPSVVDMIRSLDAFANKRITDPSQDHWIDSLNKLMTDFYLNSTSTNVRLRALEILSMCLHDFSYLHEDLVLESVVIKVIGSLVGSLVASLVDYFLN